MVGVTFQHQAVWRLNVDALTSSRLIPAGPDSQDKNAWNSACRVISGRCWVVEAPQDLQRQRVRPAVVLPFLTSLFAHTPHRG